MRDVDVLLMVEHVDRELDTLACVACLLEERFGLRVEVRNFYADYPFVSERLRPAVLAVPFFYFKGHAPMQQYTQLWPHTPILNLAWEQILYAMNQSIKVPSDAFSKSQVWHLCWTLEYRDFLIQRGVAKEKLIWTGNPVMKLYDAPYRNYFTDRAQLAARHALDPGAKWLLFPENYRWGFLSDAQIETFVKLGGERHALLEAREYCRRAMATVLHWLASVCRDSTDTVIFRPRPATNIEEVRSFARTVLGKLPPTLRIVKDESAREWIMAADHVMSSYSTTLIEAALCGKPVHLVSPEPLPSGLQDDWYDKLPWIRTQEEMLREADSKDPGDTGAHLRAWARERLLGNGDPIRNIAAALASLHPRFSQTHASVLLERAGRAPLRSYRGPSILSRLLDERRKRRMQSVEYQSKLRTRYAGYVFSPAKHEKDLFSSQDVHSRTARWSAVSRASSAY